RTQLAQGKLQMNALLHRHSWILAALGAAVLVGGCAATAPPQRLDGVPFDVGLDQAIDDLLVQTRSLPAFMAKVEAELKAGAIVVDPMLDGATGQQTVVTRQAEQRVIQRVAERFKQFSVLPFRPAE